MNEYIRRVAWLISRGSNMESGLLWILPSFLLFLLMAGCAHKQPEPEPVDLKAFVYKQISDPARAEKILALMNQTSAGINALKETDQEVQQKTMLLNADYKATLEQFRKLQDFAAESRRRNRQEILDAYFQIKALTTPQEWEALSQNEKESLKDFIKKTEVPDDELNAPPPPGSQRSPQGSTGVVQGGRIL
jgi:hypothetical protein